MRLHQFVDRDQHFPPSLSASFEPEWSPECLASVTFGCDTETSGLEAGAGRTLIFDCGFWNTQIFSHYTRKLLPNRIRQIKIKIRGNHTDPHGEKEDVMYRKSLRRDSCMFLLK